jgi:pullulanase
MRNSNILIYSLFITLISSCLNVQEYNPFLQYPTYSKNDLGLTYTPQKSTFKVYAPDADAVYMNFYDNGVIEESYFVAQMTQGDSSIWETTVDGDLLGKFYTFQVFRERGWLKEVPDPYAKAVGVNGLRAMVVDLSKTNPDGWENDRRPPLANPNDIILYELHVRDLTIHSGSPFKNRGKFLGLTESGITNNEGLSAGLDHIKELGVTHVHLLPSYDFLSLDESRPEDNKYNWGYDPQNYNVPEGSYSTNPYDGNTRIREFKKMVQTFHENGIRVILDVVYNHTGSSMESNFYSLVPGYYYRLNDDGSLSNASGCGNETASERPMMRKFMIESVKYWVEEYHLDGFRFDLMGIHDIETMNQISEELHKIDPSIFIYGEGWTAGGSPLAENLRAVKRNTKNLKNIAAFSDDMRDAVKGHVFTHDAKAFISGQDSLEESVKFGIVAATQHDQVDYEKVNYSNAPWANGPFQCINYASCHDNHTLYDRLILSCPDEPEDEIIKMHKLANTIILTSQGVPFLHAGVEFMRTKQGVENSFESPDSINQIDWSRKSRYQDVFKYYKNMIALRKNHPAFRMNSTADIQKHLKFLPVEGSNLISYQISGNANGDSWTDIVVIFNGNKESREVEIPEGDYKIIIKNGMINEAGLGDQTGGVVSVSSRSALLLVR